LAWTGEFHVRSAPFNYAGGGESSIEFSPNGDVAVLGNGDDENIFSSLAGIEFPKGFLASERLGLARRWRASPTRVCVARM